MFVFDTDGGGKYKDILDLPHHVSGRHPQMSNLNRAAQFAPFAALAGYDAVIREAARRTEEKIELDESEKAALNALLLQLTAGDARSATAAITYFCPDKKKSGGAYITVTDSIRRIDLYTRRVLLRGGTQIPIEDIYKIEIFSANERNDRAD
ncbi:MAG: hypothetical protein IJ766_09095 [Clostridia bacterium]|nr:hypothetical protein [Clostridia bacterium]